ncbi:MAG: hypothetical protein EXR98_24365, partial [Gemmataceae bacterium]|nr:hypothetical protein [Gemmataceae bacterium]
MSAKVLIRGFQQTLPDHEKAKGEYVDGRGIRTFLYRKGADYVLHTIDPNDPAVEQTATSIGSRDAALWLLAHGIEAPVELWPDLRGRVPFDADGKPIIPAVPNYPSDA